MLLIATDEAGYGPKLGPLIITGTAWEVQGHPGRESLEELFAPLRERNLCGENSVVVDDSKAVFKPSSGLAGLHAVMSACMHWCERPEESLVDALPWLAAAALVPWALALALLPLAKTLLPAAAAGFCFASRRRFPACTSSSWPTPSLGPRV